MANTVLKFKSHKVRLNYHDLAEVLSMLNERFDVTSPANQVTEQWLNHIKEDLDYVQLDTSLLHGPGVISDFDRALSKLSVDI